MIRALTLAALLWVPGTLAAQNCRLALALALDVSASVDATEYELQRHGLIGALQTPDIRDAILAPHLPPMAMAVFEWSGRNQSTLIADWVVMTDAAALDGLIDTLTTTVRSYSRFPTAMGFALGFGADLLERSPACGRKVIDVSGDGITNDGFRPKLAYEHFAFDGVTVNGLAVLGADDQVLNYYQNELRHGPGAFVETSEGYAGFQQAMTRKLFREISTMIIGQNTVPRTRPDPAKR